MHDCERALREAGAMTDALAETLKTVRRYSRFISDDELIRFLEIAFGFIGMRDAARPFVTVMSKIGSEAGWDICKTVYV